MKNDELIHFDLIYNNLSSHGKPLYVGKLLERSVNLYKDRIALIYKNQQMSYQEFYDCVQRLVGYLIKNGVRRDDHIMLCCDNSSFYYIVYFAVWQIGAIIVPINSFLKKMEVEPIVQNCNPKCIFTDDAHHDLFENAIHANIFIEKEIESIYTSIDKDYERILPVDKDPDTTAVLVYTSGTTGAPKGVMLNSRNIITNIVQSVVKLDLSGNERVLALLPLFHAFPQVTCLWISITFGTTVIIIHKIDRHAILDGLAYKPTMLLGVPALYGLLCMMKNAPLDSIKLFVSGGDALPDKIRMLFALIYRRKIVNGYGLSETSPVIAADLEDTIEYTNTVGHPVPHLECSIRDDKGNELPQGQTGELWVRGDNIMQGYFNNPNETAAVIKNGWLDTGDCGYIDSAGKLVITGREKDLIINKGVNIYPQEIENVIMSHPNVLRVAVVGQHDEEVGEIPIAFVQTRSLQQDIESILRKLCINNLAPYKIPKRFICDTQDLPTTATGKVDKKILRKKL